MSERLAVSVTYNEQRGYIATHADLREPVVAYSLTYLRQRVEELLLPDEVVVTLNLDRVARRERDRRRRGGHGGKLQWR